MVRRRDEVEVGIGMRGGLASPLARQGAAVKRFSKESIGALGGLRKSLLNVRSLLGGLAAGVVVRGLARVATRVTQLDDKMAKFARRVGVTTEFLSEMRHVGDQTGVAFETMTMALQRATRRMAQVRTYGKGEALGALQLLGLEEEVKAGATLEEMIPRIAEQMRLLESDAQRVLVAQKLFDSEGVVMVQLLQEGADGIMRLREEAKRLGLTLSQEAARNAEAFNDSLSRLGKAWEALTAHLVRSMVPVLTELIGVFETIVVKYREPILEFFRGMTESLKSIDWAQVARDVGALADNLGKAYEWGKKAWEFAAKNPKLKLFTDPWGILTPDPVAESISSNVARAEAQLRSAMAERERYLASIIGGDPGFVRSQLGLSAYGSSPDQVAMWNARRQINLSQYGPRRALLYGAGGGTATGRLSPWVERGGRITPATPRGVVDQYAQSMKEGAGAVMVTNSALQNTENLLASLALGADNWRSAMKGAVQGILADLARIAARMLLIKAIGGLLGLFSAAEPSDVPELGAGYQGPEPVPGGLFNYPTPAAPQPGGTLYPFSGPNLSPYYKGGGGLNVTTVTHINAIDPTSFTEKTLSVINDQSQKVAVNVVDQIRKSVPMQKSLRI